jgi:hypothetical protein
MSYIKLPSGKTVYANCGIIGIDEDGTLYGGYDNTLDNEYYNAEGDTITIEDKLYLADLSIARWTKFRNSLDTEHHVPDTVQEELLKALRSLVGAVKSYQFAHESEVYDAAAEMDDAVDHAKSVIKKLG